jgi:hypothetical protein
MSTNYEKVKQAIERNRFDYEVIKKNSVIRLLNNEDYDINVIIGCRGRNEFVVPIIESFENAIENTDKKVAITIVEHNKFPEHMKACRNRVNYIWTKGNVEDQYSRSFSYNFGVKYGNNATHYLLHDLDILVKRNFFEELFQNLGDKKCIQPYGGRRVLYMSKDLTDKVISKEVDFNEFNEHTENVSLPMFAGKPALGSKGGSFFITKELFEEVGGLDPEVFWGYAAEDQFFWEKVNTIDEVAFADEPLIDMFHMWHPPSHGSNPLLFQMENVWTSFKSLSPEEKIKIINLKRDLYKNETNTKE